MRSARGWVGSLLLIVLLALVLFGERGEEVRDSNPSAEVRHPQRAFVSRVVDGDTVEVKIDGDTDEVRYIGIDTPETVKPGSPVQCFGPEASSFNHRLLEGQSVRLVFDSELRDVYGRLLAYVYRHGRMVNAELVRRGYARTLTIPPNIAHAGLFHRLAAAAGRAGRGLWGAC